MCLENKSTEWHIGRVLYFIKHPEEIEVDNICNGKYICPIPVIIDGNHRFMLLCGYMIREKWKKCIVCMVEELIYWII